MMPQFCNASLGWRSPESLKRTDIGKEVGKDGVCSYQLIENLVNIVSDGVFHLYSWLYYGSFPY